MDKFGWTVPCMVADGGELIAGHGRALAATMLGLTEVPVIRLSHLDEAERRAYWIADNKLTELGEWDEAMLRDEIAGLLAEDFDLSLLGISDDDLDALLRDPEALGSDGPVEGEDDVPEIPVAPVSVPGDLWQLGAHRLICGDSTLADVVGRLLGDVRPLLMVTDPPYGVEYDPSWRNAAGAAKTKRTGKVLNDDRADWRETWTLFPGDVAYVWHGALHAATVADSLTAAGFAIRSQIIWAKDRLVLSRGDYHWQHEPCWYAVRAKGKGHWAGDRKQTTLWQIANRNQDADTVHGTQKPVECMRWPILNNSSPGQAVYEPFMGSGTTLIAAETTGGLLRDRVEPGLCRRRHRALAVLHGAGSRSGGNRRNLRRPQGQAARGMNVPLLPGRIEHWPLARLRPYAQNAKTHDADQVAKIAASMAEFGWTVPCLVAADSELIAGHGRVLAAAQLGLAEAPVIVLGYLTEAQRRAYRIADNKLTELGGWDEALLLEELRGLMAEDFDLGLIGIPEDELDALLNDADVRAPIEDDSADTIPEAPAEPITRPGDIWRLGHHRLICGDATDPAVVARLMDGAQASLLFTSPPYAQQRDYGAAKEKVGDWDALMQGVFATAPVSVDAQLLVNLGLVHRDGEWIPYWEGWVD